MMDELKKEAKRRKQTTSDFVRDALISALKEPKQALTNAEAGIASLRHLAVGMLESLDEKAELLASLSAASIAAVALLRNAPGLTQAAAQKAMEDHIDNSLLAAGDILKMREQVLAKAGNAAARP